MNEEAFLSALHENPTDEVTWLALADWLEEHGQPQRAELVRLVRRLRTIPVMRRTKKRAAAEDRVAALLNGGVRPVVPEITNSIGMRLALIPPGRFRMGSPPGEKGRYRNEKMREATVARAFYLGVFPVTQRQYETVTGDNPSHHRDSEEDDSEFRTGDTSDFPVEWVSWPEATEFCRLLTQRERESRRGRTYRLPTEEEWEYACRGGASSSTPFHYGVSLSSTQANFNGDKPSGAGKGPYLARPSAVGSYLPNAFGIYDMHGNVMEWCQDWLGNPDGPGEGRERVMRGGSCFSPARHCRSAQRISAEPEGKAIWVGFRVALAPAG
jgi:uncharacterized protein (TIGR02996 family)